jgi:hypothetical protein
MHPRPGVRPIGTAPGVYHRGEELLVAGSDASMIAAATNDVETPYPVLTRCHALAQWMQQGGRRLGLELEVNLAQATPLFRDVLAIHLTSDRFPPRCTGISSRVRCTAPDGALWFSTGEGVSRYLASD